MKRISLYFSEKNLKELKKMSKKTDVPVSALIRRSVAEFLRRKSEGNKKVSK